MKLYAILAIVIGIACVVHGQGRSRPGQGGRGLRRTTPQASAGQQTSPVSGGQQFRNRQRGRGNGQQRSTPANGNGRQSPLPQTGSSPQSQLPQSSFPQNDNGLSTPFLNDDQPQSPAPQGNSDLGLDKRSASQAPRPRGSPPPPARGSPPPVRGSPPPVRGSPPPPARGSPPPPARGSPPPPARGSPPPRPQGSRPPPPQGSQPPPPPPQGSSPFAGGSTPSGESPVPEGSQQTDFSQDVTTASG